MNCELPNVQSGFRKGRGTDIKLPTYIGSSKKQESSRKSFTFALSTTPKPLTVWITTNWKILKGEGNTRPPYLSPEKPICKSRSNSTRYGTMDWFKIGKGVHQGCLLSPCLFNLHADYIMRNAGLDATQAGIKIPGEISTTSDMQMMPL